MKRLLSGVLCLILCFGLLACAKDKSEDISDDTTKNTPVTDLPPKDTDSADDTRESVAAEEIADTEKTADTAETVDTKVAANTEEPGIELPEFSEDEIAASLVGVRQGMIDTPAMITAAYLGCTDSMEPVDTMPWLYGILPGFLNDLPFVTAIDDGHIIGDRYGEAYLIVPCDENASVAVNRIDENGEAVEVLYRSDNGDPIILFANNTGNYSLVNPDVQINIVDNNGKTFTWSPMLNDMYYLSQPSDAGVTDLTPYTETLTRDYAEFLGHNWKKPDKASLVDSSWDTIHYFVGGNSINYHISFMSDSVFLQWGEDSVTADWELMTEDGICMLKLYPGTDRERSYFVLLLEKDYLYLSQDFVNGAQRCDEPLSVMMERTYG